MGSAEVRTVTKGDTGTNHPTPTCLLDELSAVANCTSVVRLLVLLWWAPALLMIVGGGRLMLGATGPAELAGYLAVARGATVVLAIFTLLVGAMWVVRTWESVPGLYDASADDDLGVGPGEPRSELERFGLHSRFLVLALIAALAAPSLGALTDPAWLVAATCGFLSGLAIPRWLNRSGHQTARAFAALAVLMLFELTIGWRIGAAVPPLSPELVGALTLTRGLALMGAAGFGVQRLALCLGGRAGHDALEQTATAAIGSGTVGRPAVDWTTSEGSLTG